MICKFGVAFGIEIIADTTTVFCVSKNRASGGRFTFCEGMFEFWENIAFEKITAGAKIQGVSLRVASGSKDALRIRVSLLWGYVCYV